MQDEQKSKPEKKKMHRGGRNLVMLGVIATVVAAATTGVSLAIYHNSGDIYLDRSRPGFLPDEEEAEQEEEKKDEIYTFDKSGVLDIEALEEYLKMIKIEVDAIDAYERPFDAKALSDEVLGIPAETKE